MTRSEENYIKTIFHLGNKGTEAVSTNAIAEVMETKPSSVTDMVKKLSEKELVNYKKYQGVSLTELGTTTALGIIRKHRLWEVFLVEKLDFSWDEVHDVAEQLENGDFKHGDRKLLSEVPVASKGICVGVKDSSAAFLKFLDKNKIALGDEITILEKEEFDSSFYIKIADRREHISNQIASNLYIKIS